MQAPHADLIGLPSSRLINEWFISPPCLAVKSGEDEAPRSVPYDFQEPLLTRLAAAVIAVEFGGSPRGTSQLPPTHSTASSASHWDAVASVTPPVGQKRHCGNGAESALSAGMPPEATAGKNLNRFKPMSSPRMISAAVVTPGRNGTPAAI